MDMGEDWQTFVIQILTVVPCDTPNYRTQGRARPELVHFFPDDQTLWSIASVNSQYLFITFLHCTYILYIVLTQINYIEMLNKLFESTEYSANSVCRGQ